MTVGCAMDEQLAEGIMREGRLNYFVENARKMKVPGAKSGEAIARENELYVMREVRQHSVIREDELSILLGWSKQMVQRTTVRLVKTGKIVRTRAHSSYFVAIKKRKDTADIAPTWRHDALSVQALGYIRDQHPKSEIETEAQIRERIQSGKIADGHVSSSMGLIRLETEMSNKTSKPMAKQSAEAIVLTKDGITTVFAYPYPAAPFYKFDWEHRLSSAIRAELGHDNPAPHIKLLRCHMPRIIDFNHCRPTCFELIDLPPRPEVCRIGQGKKTLGEECIQGLHWKKIGEYIEGGCRNEIYELKFDHHKRGTYKFIEAPEGVPHELLEQIPDGSWVRSPAFPALQAWDVFSEFLATGKFLAEKIFLTLPNKFV